MQTAISHKFTLITFISLVIIAADQATKYFAAKYVSTYVCNGGVAFGLELASPLILILILIVVGNLALKEREGAATIAYALILGGGISNLVDRFTQGCVRDFITLAFWPSFNLADAVITVGVLALFVSLLRKKNEV